MYMWTPEQDGNFITAIKYYGFNQVILEKAKNASKLYNQT